MRKPMKTIQSIAVAVIFTVLTANATGATVTGILPEDTVHVFHFVPGNDTFFVPLKGNDAELNRLLHLINCYRAQLQSGEMYLGVSSYAATSGSELNATCMAYLRNSRVKSELILRGNVTEKMFVTDRMITAPYAPEAFKPAAGAAPRTGKKSPTCSVMSS
ncbi:MAG: hypothetical protein LUE99_03205 [Bacteroides sp.]|nr:hypothetical protein [Bacteroides sp.]